MMKICKWRWNDEINSLKKGWFKIHIDGKPSFGVYLHLKSVNEAGLFRLKWRPWQDKNMQLAEHLTQANTPYLRIEHLSLEPNRKAHWKVDVITKMRNPFKDSIEANLLEKSRNAEPGLQSFPSNNSGSKFPLWNKCFILLTLLWIIYSLQIFKKFTWRILKNFEYYNICWAQKEIFHLWSSSCERFPK